MYSTPKIGDRVEFIMHDTGDAGAYVPVGTQGTVTELLQGNHEGVVIQFDAPLPRDGWEQDGWGFFADSPETIIEAGKEVKELTWLESFYYHCKILT